MRKLPGFCHKMNNVLKKYLYLIKIISKTKPLNL